MMQKIIDGNRRNWQNNCVALNQAAKIRSLETTWQVSRFTECQAHPKRCFYACISLDLPFLNGGQGQGGFMPDGITLPLLRTLPFVRRHAFRSAKRLFENQREKADSMNPTASIGVSVRRPRAVRKGFSNPLCLHTLRIFPTFSQASRFTQQRLHRRPAYRLAIQQTAADTWAVCRVIGGGVV